MFVYIQQIHVAQEHEHHYHYSIVHSPPRGGRYCTATTNISRPDKWFCSVYYFYEYYHSCRQRSTSNNFLNYYLKDRLDLGSNVFSFLFVVTRGTKCTNSQSKD